MYLCMTARQKVRKTTTMYCRASAQRLETEDLRSGLLAYHLAPLSVERWESRSTRLKATSWMGREAAPLTRQDPVRHKATVAGRMSVANDDVVHQHQDIPDRVAQ